MKRATVHLGDFLTLKRGYDLPEHARIPGEVPVVSSSGITGTHKEAKVDGPGVVTGRYGTLGEVFYIETPFWPLNTALYVQDFKGNHRRFVSYFLKWILNGIHSDKAAVPGVNRNDLHARKVLVPNDPSEQATIASILSTYDDLIENNRRRIQLLEESARLLYKEWFVHLRFPGHEHTKITDGIPEGWEQHSLEELCENVAYGYTSSAIDEAVGPKFLRITDIVSEIINWGKVPYCKINEQKMEKFLLHEGDIVVARTGATVGYAKRIGKRSPVAVFASYLVRFRFDSQFDNILAGIFMESDYFKAHVQSNVGGAAQPNANARILGGAIVLVSPPTLQRVFRENVEPILEQRDFLNEQNQKLTHARDLLLPKLMTGEVAV